jgi:DNA polymerase III alpha subunit
VRRFQRNLNTGIHACGVIITPSDITDFVLATAKDSDLYVTSLTTWWKLQELKWISWV